LAEKKAITRYSACQVLAHLRGNEQALMIARQL
jgi:hypothetical protein